VKTRGFPIQSRIQTGFCRKTEQNSRNRATTGIIEELAGPITIERNAHGKMLFHALTIKLYHIIQDRLYFLWNEVGLRGKGVKRKREALLSC